MKISLMRFLDKYLGTFFAWIIPFFFFKKNELNHIDVNSKFLLIKFSELGAAVMLKPTCDYLSSNFNRSNIYIVSFKESKSIFKSLNYTPDENIFFIRTNNLLIFIYDFIKTLLILRKLNISIAIDFDFYSRATAIFSFLSSRYKVTGFVSNFNEAPYRGKLIQKGIRFNPYLHISTQFYNLLMVSLNKLPVNDLYIPTFDMPFSTTSYQNFINNFYINFKNYDKIYCINSNISDRENLPLRKLSDSLLVDVSIQLTKNPKSLVLYTGTSKEFSMVEELVNKINSPNCINISGKTNFLELLSILKKSNLLITTDSGPAHFAAIVNAKTLVLFGPETPVIWRPLSKNTTVLYKKLPCSPCFTVYNGRQSSCTRNLCMEYSSSEILAMINQLS